jgi:hypothetical protein
VQDFFDLLIFKMAEPEATNRLVRIDSIPILVDGIRMNGDFYSSEIKGVYYIFCKAPGPDTVARAVPQLEGLQPKLKHEDSTDKTNIWLIGCCDKQMTWMVFPCDHVRCDEDPDLAGRQKCKEWKCSYYVCGECAEENPYCSKYCGKAYDTRLVPRMLRCKRQGCGQLTKCRSHIDQPFGVWFCSEDCLKLYVESPNKRKAKRSMDVDVVIL